MPDLVFPFFSAWQFVSNGLLFLMSCQHKTEGVDGVQARGGGAGRQHPLAQTLDTWPCINSETFVQTELLLLELFFPLILFPNPSLEHGDVSS